MEENGNGKPEVRTVLHPMMQKEILDVFKRIINRVFALGGLPRIIISIKVESHLEKAMSISVDYPGLNAEKALPLLMAAVEAVRAKAHKEIIAEGPRLIVPR